MSDTFKLTMTSTLKIGLNEPDFKKWEVISSGGGKGIIIRIANKGIGYNHSLTYTVAPYPIFKKKWKRWLWWKILKIKVAIGDLYKK